MGTRADFYLGKPSPDAKWLGSIAEAAGWIGTSVTGNLFEGWDEEKDESIPYDLTTGDKHFEVYDALRENHERDENQSAPSESS